MNRQVVQRGAEPSPISMFLSDGIRIGPFVFASGLLIPTEPQDNPYHSQVRVQTERALKGLDETLAAGGSSLSNAVKLVTWHRDYNAFPAYLEARRPFVGDTALPAAAIRSGLVRAQAELEIEVVGLIPGQGAEVRVINTDRVPAPLVPGAQALEAGPFVFTAGITASDGGGALAEEASVAPGLPYFASEIKRQTSCVLDRLGHILEAAGTDLGRSVKAQVVLRRYEDFLAFDEVWRSYFGNEPPARTVFEADILHPDCLVQVELIALSHNSGLEKRSIRTESAPIPTTAEPQAVRAGDYVFTSSMMPTDFKTGLKTGGSPASDLYQEPIVDQVGFVLSSLKAVLEASGSNLESVARVGAYHTQLARDLIASMAVRRQFFPSGPPASTTVEFGRLPVPGALFMYDAIAVVPS